MRSSLFWGVTQHRLVDCVWNAMAHAQKPDFIFRRNERVHLNRRGRQFSRLLAAEMCASAVVMLDTPCSVVVWRVLATHSIRQFPLHFPSCALPCAITFQMDSSYRRFGTTYQSPCLTLEDVPGKLSRNVSNYQSTLCNIPEERRFQWILYW
jgi:hypothetical protein